ncbi:hypothetical protein CF319_g1313 [Tilletia indica]|nr:hypothetical protein CF319_g1313 [Tilletia indica]
MSHRPDAALALAHIPSTSSTDLRSAASRIPAEIWENILQHVLAMHDNQSVLCNLSRCNRRLFERFRHHLYESPVVRVPDALPLLHRSLREDPLLGLGVRCLTFAGPSDAELIAAGTDPQFEWKRLMNAIAKRCPFLHHFELWQHSSYHPCQVLPADAYFPHLTSLTVKRATASLTLTPYPVRDSLHHLPIVQTKVAPSVKYFIIVPA